MALLYNILLVMLQLNLTQLDAGIDSLLQVIPFMSAYALLLNVPAEKVV